MAENLHIVFSKRPTGVPEKEFNDWYDNHVKEILALDMPGFVGARRFRIEPVVIDPETPTFWDHLTLWIIEGDPEAAMEEQKKRGLDTKESYVALKQKDTSGPPLPDWWDEVRFASWNGCELGERAASTT